MRSSRDILFESYPVIDQLWYLLMVVQRTWDPCEDIRTPITMPRCWCFSTEKVSNYIIHMYFGNIITQPRNPLLFYYLVLLWGNFVCHYCKGNKSTITDIKEISQCSIRFIRHWYNNFCISNHLYTLIGENVNSLHTCIDDIPKSIWIPSAPDIKSFSSTSDSVDHMFMKFRKKVWFFSVEVESSGLKVSINSILAFAFSWASGSKSSPIYACISGWTLIICFIYMHTKLVSGS